MADKPLSPADRKLFEEYYALKAEELRRVKTRRIYAMYPEEGPLSRHAYKKHMHFFEAGARYSERAIIAANRVGKTYGIGGYELVWHLTGRYPEWWTGKRFTRAIKAWAAGTTNQKTKEILQEKLVGPISEIGTGLIPGDEIVEHKKKASSVPDVIETVLVRHISGDVSTLVFKSFEQGREAFEGTEQDVILLDEEPPADVYEECTIRTMTTKGIILLTFTPLQGVSDVVRKFMSGGVPVDGEVDGRYLVTATWDDAPHLTPEDKKRLWNSLPPHQRDARARGIPSLGAGAIYPIMESEFAVDDFEIPAHWPMVYGFDVGWHHTAAVWAAWDKQADVLYLTSCYKKGLAEPAVHVAGIKARGSWINGVADPGAAIGNQKDGDKLLDEYIALGLRLVKADNSVETGIFKTWTRLSEGRLKVFKSCVQWWEEFRVYQRDKNGHVRKVDDHLMDCSRYICQSGVQVATCRPVSQVMQMFAQADQGYDALRHGL